MFSCQIKTPLCEKRKVSIIQIYDMTAKLLLYRRMAFQWIAFSVLKNLEQLEIIYLFLNFE